MRKMNKFFPMFTCLLVMSFLLTACDAIFVKKKDYVPETKKVYDINNEIIGADGDINFTPPEEVLAKIKENANINKASISIIESCTILDMTLKGDEKYYDMTKLNDGHALLYVVPDNENAKHKTVTLNAGHGAPDGLKYKTYCHPDKSQRMDQNEDGSPIYKTYSITDGMVFPDGRSEDTEVLSVALYTRDELLKAGYNVLMIREDSDSRLDNISRAILANNHSDMHISLHFDSTESNKGMFVVVPVKVKAYTNMEPIKSNYTGILGLANAMVEAWREDGLKVFREGTRGEDLTQISYSTVPSIDIELGDKATVLDDELVDKMAKAIVHGVDKFFDQQND